MLTEEHPASSPTDEGGTATATATAPDPPKPDEFRQQIRKLRKEVARKAWQAEGCKADHEAAVAKLLEVIDEEERGPGPGLPFSSPAGEQLAEETAWRDVSLDEALLGEPEALIKKLDEAEPEFLSSAAADLAVHRVVSAFPDHLSRLYFACLAAVLMNNQIGSKHRVRHGGQLILMTGYRIGDYSRAALVALEENTAE